MPPRLILSLEMACLTRMKSRTLQIRSLVFVKMENIFLTSLLEYYMIMFGDNPNKKFLNGIQWVFLIAFTFLVNVLNLNLLISIIGDTFEKVQST